MCHRYANVDGKWQRVYDFKDHKTSHAMREMLPVFHDYSPPSSATQGDAADVSQAVGSASAAAW